MMPDQPLSDKGKNPEEKTLTLENAFIHSGTEEPSTHIGRIHHVANAADARETKKGDIVVVNTHKGEGYGHAVREVVDFSDAQLVFSPRGKAIAAHFGITAREREIILIFADINSLEKLPEGQKVHVSADPKARQIRIDIG